MAGNINWLESIDMEKYLPQNVALVAKNFLKLPALFLRNRTSLDNADFVTYSGFTLFIMSVELLRALDDLFETWVRHTVGVFNNDGLIHAGGHYDADACFALAFGFRIRIAHDRKRDKWY